MYNGGAVKTRQASWQKGGASRPRHQQKQLRGNQMQDEERELKWQYLNHCWKRLFLHERALRNGGQVVGSIHRDYNAVKKAQMDLGLEGDDQLPYERLTING